MVDASGFAVNRQLLTDMRYKGRKIPVRSRCLRTHRGQNVPILQPEAIKRLEDLGVDRGSFYGRLREKWLRRDDSEHPRRTSHQIDLAKPKQEIGIFPYLAD